MDLDLSHLPQEYIFLMKNVLYKYINKDIDYIHEVFLHYKYPNIADDSVNGFCKTLIEWIQNIQSNNEQDNFALESVRQLLNSAKKLNKLCFLTENTDLLLMDSYESLYIEPIYLFVNSKHIFDEETEIMGKIQQSPIYFDGKLLSNYSFVKSHESKWVQLSDVITGVLGKMFSYANSTSPSEIKSQIISESNQQKINIQLLNKLLDMSAERCPAFLHYTANYYESEKCNLILTGGTETRDNEL